MTRLIKSATTDHALMRAEWRETISLRAPPAHT